MPVVVSANAVTLSDSTIISARTIEKILLVVFMILLSFNKIFMPQPFWLSTPCFCEHLIHIRNSPRFHWGPPYKRALHPTHFVTLQLESHLRTIPQISVATRYQCSLICLRVISRLTTTFPSLELQFLFLSRLLNSLRQR